MNNYDNTLFFCHMKVTCCCICHQCDRTIIGSCYEISREYSKLYKLHRSSQPCCEMCMKCIYSAPLVGAFQSLSAQTTIVIVPEFIKLQLQPINIAAKSFYHEKCTC